MSKRKILTIAVSCVVMIIMTVGGIVFAVIGNNHWGEWEVYTLPTCEAVGVERRTNVFGRDETREIPALGHEYDATVRQPSCTKDGFCVYECSRCDSAYVSNFEEALGHSFGEWEIKNAATCTISGIDVQMCHRCEETNRRIVDAQGHLYSPVSTETVDGVIVVTYVCQTCDRQQTLQEGEELVEQAGSNQVLDVSPTFGFIIRTTGDESYITENLRIIDAYFDGSEYELYEGVKIPYTLRKVDGQDAWEIMPSSSYEFDMTYMAKLSGDLSFVDYQGETLIFTIEEDENHVNNVEFKDTIVFLHALETGAPGYYPYLITAPENSEYLYLTVGKVDGLEVGQILCIGEITSIEEFTEDIPCDFGKIDEIYPLQTGEWVVVLSAPNLGEVFSVLDISFNEMIDLGAADIDVDQVGEELVNALYSDEEFVRFLGAVNVASVQYMNANNLDATPVLTTTSFMDKVTITPSVTTEGSKLKAVLRGKIDIPLKGSNNQNMGSLKVNFAFEIESQFTVSVSYKIETKWFIPVGIEYLDLNVTQTNVLGFEFDVNIDLDYSLQDGEFIQNMDGGKIHRRGCVHVSQVVDASKLKYISAVDAEKEIKENPKRECRHCNPVTGFDNRLVVLNTKNKTIHAYSCAQATLIKDENKLISPENSTYWMVRGYSCCDHCHPDSREEITYTTMLRESLEYSDWQQVATDISQWAKEAGIEEYQKKEIRLTKIDIPVFFPVSVEFDLHFVLSIKLEASLSYEYKYEQCNTYGMRLDGWGVSPYTSKSSRVLANDLNIMGHAEIRAGILADVNVNISGLTRWVRAGVTAEGGLYIRVSGILHLSGVTHENYAAAYMELGAYVDVSAYYKLFSLTGNVSIYSNEWPIVRLGYERAYYTFVDPVSSLEIDGSYNLSALLAVKYYDLKSMTTAQTTLEVGGQSGLYTVSVTLEDGRYFYIRDGRIIENADAPCQFTDVLKIKVAGASTTWKEYQNGRGVFYLKEYVIPLSGSGTIHSYVGHDCTTCGEVRPDCVDENKDHACDWCGGNVAEHADRTGDGDHACDHCGVGITACVDSNSDHICEECGVVSAHVGGTATCVDLAICSVCSEGYGELNGSNHTLGTVWIKNSTMHQKIHSCCQIVVIDSEAHDWVGGVCVDCGHRCAHTGGTATCTTTKICTECGEAYGSVDAENHVGDTIWAQTNTTHRQTYDCCLIVVVAEEPHEWRDGVCAECGYVCAHTGGTATCQRRADCSECNEAYGDLAPEAHVGVPEWERTAETHFKRYTCCGVVATSEEEHTWNGDSICSACGYGCTHTGGVATCQQKATCSLCEQSYGDLNRSNHIQESRWRQTPTSHEKYYVCCNAIVVSQELHEWEDSSCVECLYVCEHTGGTATCHSLAVCVTCQSPYGVLDGENHTGQPEWSRNEHTHEMAYTCCGEAIVAEEGHEWSSGVCLECAHVCVHSGGTATCLGRAVCDFCAESYGSIDADHHVTAVRWIQSGDTHEALHDCCGVYIVPMEGHEWSNGACVECDYMCIHDYIDDYCVYCGLAYTPSQGLDITVGETSCTVNGIGTCTDTQINIPSTYQGLPITNIAGNAFYKCSNLISVNIPDSVVSIGSCAFYDCTNIVKLNIPERIKYIGSYAFLGCHPNITTLDLSNLTSLGMYAFPSWVSLETVMLGDNITCIDDSTFTGCKNLRSINIPSGVRFIGSDAFYGCTSLTEIIIPDSVTSIHEGAFKGCTGLKNVVFGNGLLGIGYEAFSGCSGLTNLTVRGDDFEIDSRAFQNCTSLITVVLEDGVRRLNQYAFAGCKKLASITLPSTLGNIDTSAFGSCDALVEVINHSSLDIQAGSTAYGGVAQKALEVHSGESKLGVVGDFVFYTLDAQNYLVAYMGADTKIVLPEAYCGKTYVIFPKCFYGNKVVTEVIVSDGVTEIGDSAFSGCQQLQTMVIGQNVTSIENYAIFGCSKLTTISLPTQCLSMITSTYRKQFETIIFTGGTTIDARLMKDATNLRSVTIGDSITTIGDEAFYGCTNLTSVNMGNGVRQIGHSAFYNCGNLTNVSMSSSVEQIGDYAFYQCSVMNDVDMPESVASIGAYAFYKCKGLSRLTISWNTVSIGEYAFGSCSGLQEITILQDLLNEGATLTIGERAFAYCTGVTSLTLPDTVTTIGKGAFYACSGLSVIDIPDSVTNLGEEAFYACSGLVVVTIGDGITRIESNAFYRCTSLRTINWGENIESIEEGAFSGCTSLVSITLPERVTSLGRSAFYNCTELTAITIGSNLSSFGYNVFWSCSKLTDVYYTGTEQEWKAISGVSCVPATATIHYNYQPE